MKDLEDISLVAQAAGGRSRKAFDKLVRKYQSPLRLFFLSQTMGDKQLSDDLAQDTFIKAYLNLDKFRGESSFSTWLYRIGYNVYCDYVRHNRLTDDIDSVNLRPTLVASQSTGLTLDMQNALLVLNDKERICITMQLVEGLATEHIAEITGMSSGTVRSCLSRGKQKLANYLRQNGYERK